MRTRWAVALLIAAGCGTEAPPPSTTAAATTAESAPQARWLPVVPGRLEVSVRERLGHREGGDGVVFRLTNHGDVPLLVDLRHLGRVLRPDAPSALRLPLSAEQIAELSSVSALAQVQPAQSITYAVAFAAGPCEGTRTVALGGTLTAMDDGRTIEIVADGAQAALSCDAPMAAPAGTTWVTAEGALASAGAEADAFGAGLPDLIRAAAVSGSADVALLPFSYDALPIERWRYDACVSLGRCPERAMAQPPGSIRAPAVGMTSAGVEAFCATRSLRAPSAAEAEAIADPARALLTADAPDVVTSGFRCARSVGETGAAP